MVKAIFDMDLTLIDTSALFPYRNTIEGRQFILDNLKDIPTKEYHPSIKEIVKILAKENNVAIVTNTSEEEAKRILRKHNFPDVPLVGNAKKPMTFSLEKAIAGHSVEFVCVIGDEPVDSVQATLCKVASASAMWGVKNISESQKKFELSDVQWKINDPLKIKEAIDGLGEGYYYWYGFEPRKPYEPLTTSNIEDIPILSVGKYEKNGNKYGYLAKTILDFKSAKQFYRSELNKGVNQSYFFGGTLRKGRNLREIILNLSNSLRTVINNNIQGTYAIIAAPNSIPDYCFHSDVNHIVAEILENKPNRKRDVVRFEPLRQAHTSGVNRPITQEHIDSCAYDFSPQVQSADNVLIFDDVSTTGAQINAIGSVLRSQGYKGNIFGLVIGDAS